MTPFDESRRLAEEIIEADKMIPVHTSIIACKGVILAKAHLELDKEHRKALDRIAELEAELYSVSVPEGVAKNIEDKAVRIAELETLLKDALGWFGLTKLPQTHEFKEWLDKIRRVLERVSPPTPHPHAKEDFPDKPDTSSGQS